MKFKKLERMVNSYNAGVAFFPVVIKEKAGKNQVKEYWSADIIKKIMESPKTK